MMKKFNDIKTELLKFTEMEIEKFLNEHSEKVFYAFAYDCNAEYAEINLCFNTEDEFEKTLEYYQNGKYSQHYKTDEQINELKYNTGDWKYQCFASTNVFTDNELTKIFQNFPDDDYKSWQNFVEELMVLFTKTLIDFSKSKVFTKIPKTENFEFFCIDHDEDLEDVENRIKKITAGNISYK